MLPYLRQIKRRLHNSRKRAELAKVLADDFHPYRALQILKRQRFLCAYCHEDIRQNWSIDHIIPITRGGPHCIQNIHFTCLRCNFQKRNKIRFHQPKVKHVFDWRPSDPISGFEL